MGIEKDVDTMSMLNVPKLDLEKVVSEITEFIRRIVDNAKAEGIVVGLSGGVDSSVVATLCVRALGKEKVLGVLMPTEFTPSHDVEDAKELAKKLEISTEFVNIRDIAEAFSKELRCNPNDLKQKMPIANVHARIRMVILYYYANLNNYLVAGTGDRSEDLIGYFTKYGDGGVDFMPISHLYKTQVRELAGYLGIPEKIAYKPSSPQLFPGHKATDEIPVDYEKLDLVLVGIFDYKLEPKEVSRLTGIPIKSIEDIVRRFNESKHKREYLPMVKGWDIGY